MSAFLVVAAPLWYLLIVSFFKTPSRGWRGILIPWFGGLLIGMAALLVTLSFLSRVPFGLDFNQLYFWVWLRGTGWPMVLGVPAVILAHIFKPTSYSRTRNAAGWFSGVATVYMIWTALILDPGFDAYRVLFTPLVWIAMLGVTVFLVDRGLRLSSKRRYLMFAMALIAPSLFTLIPMLYIVGGKFAAWLIVLVLAGGSSMLAPLDSRGWPG